MGRRAGSRDQNAARGKESPAKIAPTGLFSVMYCDQNSAALAASGSRCGLLSLLHKTGWLILATFATAFCASVVCAQGLIIPPQPAASFWTSPLWGVAAAIGAIVIVPITIWGVQKQRSIKRLVIDVSPAIPLFSIAPLIRDRLRVTYDDREIHSASITPITFRNKGSAPISRLDFDGTISITITGVETVLSADTSLNKEIQLTHVIEAESVYIDPFLLNKNEDAYINIISLNGYPSSAVKCRIIGGEAITQKQFEILDRRRDAIILWSSSIILGGLTIILTITGLHYLFLYVGRNITLTIIISISYILSMVKFLTDNFRRN